MGREKAHNARWSGGKDGDEREVKMKEVSEVKAKAENKGDCNKTNEKKSHQEGKLTGCTMPFAAISSFTLASLPVASI